jgi:hypothetical protein
MTMPNKIAALNWRWRIQSGHRGLQFGLVSCVFNDAMDMVSFVDGHVSYIKMYWKSGPPPTTLFSGDYDPPAGYDYQWSGN